MNIPRMPARERLAEDRSVAFELSAEDKLTLTRMFLETSHEDLRLLERALLDGAPGEMLHRVHRLHGAALTVGATALAAELESFEKILRETLRIPDDSQVRLSRLRLRLQDYQQLAAQ